MGQWGKSISVWLDTTPETDYGDLAGDLAVDVAIAGGGIAGLTIAWQLMQQGLKVAVVEAMRIVEDVTGYTTGKLTYQHGQLLGIIAGGLGEPVARIYAEANQAGLECVTSIIQDNDIDCDFRRADAYLFTEMPEYVASIEAEVQLARRLGLPASFVDETPMPFALAAMRITGQAQFHPRKYLLFLARAIVAEGGHVFENTRATDIVEQAGSRGVVLRTDRGDIRAANVIVATNTPFYRRESFAQLFALTRSFVLGVRLRGPVPEGLYYCVDPLGSSMRNQPVEGGTLLMVGCWDKELPFGEIDGQFKVVETYARKRLPIESIDYHWFTQDQKTPDRVPCVGWMPGSRSVMVATGFGGWGMTTSGVAAMILSDLIAGKENPWAEIYAPGRLVSA